jgi:hypothetical protein
LKLETIGFRVSKLVAENWRSIFSMSLNYFQAVPHEVLEARVDFKAGGL